MSKEEEKTVPSIPIPTPHGALYVNVLSYAVDENGIWQLVFAERNMNNEAYVRAAVVVPDSLISDLCAAHAKHKEIVSETKKKMN